MKKMKKEKSIKAALLALSIIIVSVLILVFIFESNDHSSDEPVLDRGTTLDEAGLVAENWIREHSGTYRDRGGYDLSIIEKSDLGEGWYEFYFRFNTEEEGYGRKEDGIETESITDNREIVVRTNYNIVEAVIVDGKYNDQALKLVDSDLPGPENEDFELVDTDEDELEDNIISGDGDERDDANREESENQDQGDSEHEEENG